MSESNDHIQGTPVFWDLASEDVDASKSFYSALLGWEWQDLMASPEGVYSLASIDGETVAGIYTYKPGMPLPSGPLSWVNAFWVNDAEAAAARAIEKGASVIMPPCDDPASGGKKALLLNPEGAPFVVWSGDNGIEEEAFGNVGAVVLLEYYTRDVQGINEFMQHVFGSRYQQVVLTRKPAEFEDAEGDIEYGYHWLKVDGLEPDRGGMLEMDDSWGDMPSHFMVYFRVEDCDASAAMAASLGGEICVPPTRIPKGRFSVINDPQGATFSIISVLPFER